MKNLRLPLLLIAVFGGCLVGSALAQNRTSTLTGVINLGELRSGSNPQMGGLTIQPRAIRALSQSETLNRVRQVAPQVTSLSGQKWRITPANLSNGPISVQIFNISRIVALNPGSLGETFLLVNPGSDFGVYFMGLKPGGKYLVTLEAFAGNLEITTFTPSKVTTTISRSGEPFLIVFQAPLNISEIPQIWMKSPEIWQFTSLELAQLN
jgi:hypothetical protein